MQQRLHQQGVAAVVVLLIVLGCSLLTAEAAAGQPEAPRTAPTAAAAPPPAPSQPCPAAGSDGIIRVASSCVLDVGALDVGSASKLQLLGATSSTHGLPIVQLHGTPSEASLRGVRELVIHNMILGASGAFPAQSIDLGSLLAPPLLLPPDSQAAVQLQNVALLHSVAPAQAAVAVATLRGVVSDPLIQQRVANWSLNLYTDYSSYAYVDRWASPRLSANGCGVFLRFGPAAAAAAADTAAAAGSLLDPPTSTPDELQRGVNYLLNVNNVTFVPSLVRYGGIATPRQFLLLLTSNITWGRHPALKAQPGGSMTINRPVVLLGQAGGVTTGVDLGMVANAVRLTGAFSNVTFHGLHTENLGFGDHLSGQTASGLSLINPFNYWIFYWPRTSIRFSLVNTTSVASQQTAVDYLTYMQLSLSSSNPAKRARVSWVSKGPLITVWESLAFPGALYDYKFVCGTSLGRDLWRVATPTVFPQLPDNIEDPMLVQQALKTHAAAPLSTLSGSAQELQSWLSRLTGLTREGLTLVVAPQLSLAPDEAGSWPPAGGITLKAPSTVVVGQRACASSSAASTAAAVAAAAEASGGPGAPFRNISGGSNITGSSGGGVLLDEERVMVTSMPQQALLRGMGLSEADAAQATGCRAGGGSSSSSSNSSLGAAPSSSSAPSSAVDRLGHLPIMDMAQQTGLITLQPPPSNSSMLELSSLTLVGLPQGFGGAAARSAGADAGAATLVGRRRRLAAAVAAAVAALPSQQSRARSWRRLLQQQQGLSQADPRVWTHLVWPVLRAPGSGQLSLRRVALGLPAPEFQRLLAASRAAPGGAFTIELRPGVAPLAAASSSFVDGCCLLLSSYTGPGLNASQLLLFADPDAGRSMPAGSYQWPYDGSEGAAAAGAQQRSSGGSLSTAAVAGLVVGLVVAAVAAGALLWLLLARRRRRQRWQQQEDGKALPATAEGQHGSGSSATAPPSGALHGTPCGSSDTRAYADASAVHNGSPAAAAAAVDSSGVLSNPRWNKLATAISDKVQDIHQQRLRTALLTSSHSPAGGSSSAAVVSIATSGALPRGGSSSSHSLDAAAASAASSVAASAAAAAAAAEQQRRQDALALQLQELIGRGSFGLVYKGRWRGLTVAVKLLQLPPGTTRTMTDSGLFDGDGGTAGLLRAVGGWPPSAALTGTGSAQDERRGGLHKREQMAVQEAAIGSTVAHPNVVSVYSISLRPAGPSAARPQLPLPAAGNAPGSSLLVVDDAANSDQQQQQQQLDLMPWEMQLILEYCDQGTLRDALDAGQLVDPATGMQHVPTVLALAHNVACAMAYLHQEHILHGDLKSSNVLLKSSAPDSGLGGGGSSGARSVGGTSLAAGPHAAAVQRGGAEQPQQPEQQQQQQNDGAGRGPRAMAGAPAPPSPAAAAAAPAAAADAPSCPSLLKCGWVVAKVSDFGLSLCMKPDETHVSSVHAGTLVYMAPEMLMHGICSKASDVYAFGVLLWELATGGRPFAGVPKPLLGHCVISQGMRPTWPAAMRAPAPAPAAAPVPAAQDSGGSSSGSSLMRGSGAPHGPWEGIIALTERCWAQDSADRPAFAEVLLQLSALLKAAQASTAAAP